MKRNLLAVALVSLLAPGAATAQRELILLPTSNEARAFEKFEMVIEVPSGYANPFDPDEVELNVRFTSQSSKETTVVPAFFGQHYERRRVGERDWFYPMGPPVWRVRFAAWYPGRYEAVAALKDRKGSVHSKPHFFECRPSRSPGFVGVSGKDPRFLEFSSGAPFFPIGQNLAFIGNQQYVSLTKADQIFRQLSTNGANYLRVWTCCEDWAMAIEARKSAFGRSWDWRPPLAALPGGDRKFLHLAAARPQLQVESSHPVALRPGTLYVLSGKACAPEGATFDLTVHGSKVAPTVIPAGQGTNWTSFHHEWQSGAQDFWLGQTSLRLAGGNALWLDSLSLRESAGGPELLWEADIQRRILGYYNPLDCFMLDELVNAAHTNSIYLQLCLLTRDLYMDRLKNASGEDYNQAIRDAKRTLRYAIARWGYSTSVAAWEYWNEMNPGLPTDRYYTELGAYLAANDPYQHLRRTSTWGPSTKDCRHASLDVADVHFYLRPTDKGRIRDEVHAVIERTQWLRAQTPNKPVQVGEFGLADDKWGITEEMKRSPQLIDAHNALWASALSGASGTAMFWWWERLDQRGFYPHYKPLSAFMAAIPWNSGYIRVADATVAHPDAEVVGLTAGPRAWLWVHNRQSTWGNVVTAGRSPATLSGVQLSLKSVPAGRYSFKWTSTRDGSLVLEGQGTAVEAGLQIAVPEFAEDIACQVQPASP